MEQISALVLWAGSAVERGLWGLEMQERRAEFARL